MTSILIYSLFACGFWIFILSFLLWTLRTIPLLSGEAEALCRDEEHWPKLSIIVPACNEAAHIEHALKTLLAQDYPNLEVIAIDDRSTDTTGEILDRLAGADARLRVLHLTELPKGWLGKVHALHRGVQIATGDWYLFTDADIYFEPRALRRAICYARHHQANHLVCMPRVETDSFWLNVAICSFGLLFFLTARVGLVNRPNSKTPIGVGAFNLVEAQMFRRTPGFEWLRMEPTDDYGLGLMINRGGGRTRFVVAEDEMAVPWYETLGDMIRGVEKNAFGPGAHYQWWRLSIQVGLLWALVAAPVVALVTGIVANNPLLLGTAGTIIAALAGFALLTPRGRNIPASSILFFPVGMLMMSAMMLRAAYRCTRNDGISWRGTHYSLAELRAGQRVRF